MFSLLGYKRQSEFWRDMWVMLLEPISKIQPIKLSLDPPLAPTPKAPQPSSEAPAVNDKA